MKHSFCSLLCAFIFCAGLCAQTTVTVKVPKREIRFINLQAQGNENWWGQGRELPRLIMDAIGNGSISACKRTVTNGKEEIVTLGTAEYEHCLQIPGTDPYIQYFFHVDFTRIGLDQTYGTISGKEYAQVHYVHFYVNEAYAPEDKTFDLYRFSVRWEDFIKVLKARPDLLYTTNAFSSWWRGDVFLTHNRYAVDLGYTGDFIRLSQSGAGMKAAYFNYPELPYSLASYKAKSYKGYPIDFFPAEQEETKGWKMQKLVLGELKTGVSYEYAARFEFDWNDFIQLAEEKKWTTPAPIFTFADAFAGEQFVYASALKPVKISRKGAFRNGAADPLCSRTILPSFTDRIEMVSDTVFHTTYSEGLYLADSVNRHLHIPGHSLSEIIYDHVLSGKLMAYQNDSLTSVKTVDEIRKAVTSFPRIEPYVEDDYPYAPGDTVMTQYYLSDSDHLQYYIVRQAFRSDANTPDSVTRSYMERYNPPLYTPAQLYVLELQQRVTFNRNGENKQYELQSLSVNIPADMNVTGIEYPAFFVRWEDLKPLLLADSRASFIFRGRESNLCELMEHRRFLSYFYKTGFLERE